MDFGLLLYSLPLWLIFIITTVIAALASESGRYLAQVVQRSREKEPEAPLGSVVGSVLGLLAFLLAFTFGMTASRFETRKQLVLDEANAIGTCYLRAGLLPTKQKQEIRQQLREYIDGRIHVNIHTVTQLLHVADEQQDRLWNQAESLVSTDMDSEIRSLFISSLNDVIDLHESRKMVSLHYRIPGSIWLSLYLLTVLSMGAIGYQVGMAGTRRMLGMPLIVVAFSLVIVMIADIDQPGEGRINVSFQPLIDTQQMMLRN